MATVPEVFERMSSRYKAGVLTSDCSYYFSIGEHKYTVRMTPDGCTVEEGKTLEKADVILKTTPDLFLKMVLKKKMPGALDIARGRIKTNDPLKLKDLMNCFDF